MEQARFTLTALTLLAATQAAQAGITTYHVEQTYNQVVYDLSFPGWDTLFKGSFDFDPDTGTVSNLRGSLSQAMTGESNDPGPNGDYGMDWLDLTHPLSVVADGADGLVVTVFKENSTDVFAGGGFASTGKMGKVYTYGNFNAFASIYVPLADPTAALTQAQIDKLAYGDCTPGGLMPLSLPAEQRTICMAGWVAYDANGNPGPGGTMKGTWPITQTITAAPVPEPETYALMLVGLGLVGALTRRR